MPRKAVFVLKQPLEAPNGMRLRFKLTQDHGGWNSDDNENNNLGRIRFAVTAAAETQLAAGFRNSGLIFPRHNVIAEGQGIKPHVEKIVNGVLRSFDDRLPV